MKLDYKKTQAGVQREMTRLGRVRARLTKMLSDVDRRIEALSAAADGLARAIGVDAGPEPLPARVEEAGFQIRPDVWEVLQAISPEYPISALDIRNELVSRGWKADNYRDPLAAVRRALKQHVQSGDVGVSHENGLKCYYDARSATEKEAKAQEARAARAEVFSKLADKCYEILAAHGDLTGREIAQELEKSGFDMSCYNHPPSAIKMALKNWPCVRYLRAERHGYTLGFYRAVEAKDSKGHGNV